MDCGIGSPPIEIKRLQGGLLMVNVQIAPADTFQLAFSSHYG